MHLTIPLSFLLSAKKLFFSPAYFYWNTLITDHKVTVQLHPCATTATVQLITVHVFQQRSRLGIGHWSSVGISLGDTWSLLHRGQNMPGGARAL
jgi:hypothetical protein